MDTNKPYEAVFKDMGIDNDATKEEVLSTLSLFAQQCYNMAIQGNYADKEQIDGHFHIQIFTPTRFFKIFFSYFHSEEWLVAIRGFEELTLEQYLHSMNDKPERDHVEIINKNSILAQNNEQQNQN